MTLQIQGILDSISLEDLLREDGHTLRRSGANLVCCCPFHEERTGSFTLFPDGKFKCFSCGAHGDVLDYYGQSRGVSPAESRKALASRANLTPPMALPSRAKAAKGKEPRLVDTSAWPVMDKGTRADVEQVAKLRGLDPEALEIAVHVGWLRFAERGGHRAWIVTDPTRQNAQARRLDGTPWPEIGGKKAWTLSGSRASWPLGIVEAKHYPRILLVEGGPDWLAALHLLLPRNMVTWCPVAMLGASNSIPEDALPYFQNKAVRIFPHDDEAGRKAFARWGRQLMGVGCKVDGFDMSGLTRADGRPVGDLNDAALICEADAGKLKDLLP